MATIEFKAKVENVYTADGALAYRRIKVPILTRTHCDMAEFRQHKKFGGVANSDLFSNALARIRRDVFGDHIRLDRIPAGVIVDETGFLVRVTVSI